MKALFVCIGNACRNPMTEALFTFESAMWDRQDIATSCSIHPFHHVIHEIVDVLKEGDIDDPYHTPKDNFRRVRDQLVETVGY